MSSEKKQGVWAGLVGKKKFLLTGIFAFLVGLNGAFQWGISEVEIERIFILVLSVLGIDGAEGIAASLSKRKA